MNRNDWKEIFTIITVIILILTTTTLLLDKAVSSVAERVISPCQLEQNRSDYYFNKEAIIIGDGIIENKASRTMGGFFIIEDKRKGSSENESQNSGGEENNDNQSFCKLLVIYDQPIDKIDNNLEKSICHSKKDDELADNHLSPLSPITEQRITSLARRIIIRPIINNMMNNMMNKLDRPFVEENNYCIITGVLKKDPLLGYELIS